jgi:hypothetical protein
VSESRRSSEGERNHRPSGVVEYLLPGGWQVLAGRTAAANDYLSLRLVRPNDLWFHIRGMPGGHVLLRVPEGADARSGDAGVRGGHRGLSQQGSHSWKGGRVLHRGAARVEAAARQSGHRHDSHGEGAEGPPPDRKHARDVPRGLR